jgi:MoaA/NifB/PqqE/SkfB family radical SAM enzyme
VCNLTCEGCYYFVSGQKTPNRRPTAATYNNFFASEAARGVNYPQFSGGEPSLNTRALRIAAQHWSAGIIYTNGVKRIPAEVPFRIAISVWGARAHNDRLRGAGAYDQALSAAVGDRRALVYLTINRENIEDIPLVAADCAAKGVPLSFNDFSMTTEYIRLIAAGDTTSNPFVRTSTLDQNLSLSLKDRLRAADLIDAVMDCYPETILYARVLNDFVHRSPTIFDIDPATGVATNCAYLGVEWHRGYDYDLHLLRGKRCCAPEFDCSDCRVGPAAAFTLLMTLAGQMRRSETARRDVHQLREHMMKFYYWNWDLEHK